MANKINGGAGAAAAAGAGAASSANTSEKKENGVIQQLIQELSKITLDFWGDRFSEKSLSTRVSIPHAEEDRQTRRAIHLPREEDRESDFPERVVEDVRSATLKKLDDWIRQEPVMIDGQHHKLGVAFQFAALNNQTDIINHLIDQLLSDDPEEDCFMYRKRCIFEDIFNGFRSVIENNYTDMARILANQAFILYICEVANEADEESDVDELFSKAIENSFEMAHIFMDSPLINIVSKEKLLEVFNKEETHKSIKNTLKIYMRRRGIDISGGEGEEVLYVNRIACKQSKM